MAKQYLIPYSTEQLEKVPGFKAINIDGASMMYFNNVDEALLSELMYPCRINALMVLVCVRGEISLSAQMSNYTIGAGQFFISSSSVFQIKSLGGSECYLLALSSEFLVNMNVDLRFVMRMTAQLRANAYITDMDTEKLFEICGLYNSLLADYTGELSEYKEQALRHIFCSTIYRMADPILARGKTTSSSGVKDRSTEYFERLLLLLAEHYREQRSVEFYAEKMHISSKHLSRVIRAFTGKSVHQWIDDFVALEIKNLLKYSNMSIQQISYYLNFPNPSFMGQYFKRITGMTPGEYKKS